MGRRRRRKRRPYITPTSERLSGMLEKIAATPDDELAEMGRDTLLLRQRWLDAYFNEGMTSAFYDMCPLCGEEQEEEGRGVTCVPAWGRGDVYFTAFICADCVPGQEPTQHFGFAPGEEPEFLLRAMEVVQDAYDAGEWSKFLFVTNKSDRQRVPRHFMN